MIIAMFRTPAYILGASLETEGNSLWVAYQY